MAAIRKMYSVAGTYVCSFIPVFFKGLLVKVYNLVYLDPAHFLFLFLSASYTYMHTQLLPCRSNFFPFYFLTDDYWYLHGIHFCVYIFIDLFIELIIFNRFKFGVLGL